MGKIYSNFIKNIQCNVSVCRLTVSAAEHSALLINDNQLGQDFVRPAIVAHQMFSAVAVRADRLRTSIHLRFEPRHRCFNRAWVAENHVNRASIELSTAEGNDLAVLEFNQASKNVEEAGIEFNIIGAIHKVNQAYRSGLAKLGASPAARE